MLPTFIPGLELSRLFYQEAVKPILDSHFPNLKYSVALIGYGSGVLGFDTDMSSDHHWGPRAMLFLLEADRALYCDAVREVMSYQLPLHFLGFPTNYAPSSSDPPEHGVLTLRDTNTHPICHRVEMYTLRKFFLDYLDFDLDKEIEPADWLTFPEQKLRTLTSGAVYHDGVGLQRVRDRFAYYPHDVWLYLLAAGWTRIRQD